MDLTRERILFVTQDGAVTGAELFLLYFVRWLRENTDLELEVWFWHDGPLVDEFAEVASTRVLHELNQWRPARLAEILRLRRPAQVLKGLRLRWWLHRRRSARALYVNGLDAARILGFVVGGGRPTVVHVHDTAGLADGRLSAGDRSTMARKASRFVAVSDAVAQDLRTMLPVSPERVVRHDYFIVADPGVPPPSAQHLSRRRVGIPPDAFVLGGIGTRDWWASPEQFVLMAWALGRDRPTIPFHFLWIAPDADERLLWPLRHDLRNAGLADRTTVWTGSKPLDALHVVDALVFTTREEPFELVAMEAAAAGIPIVCTDNVLPNLRAGASALVAPYLDVDALVERVAALAENREEREQLVERARRWALTRHDVTVGAADLLEVVLEA